MVCSARPASGRPSRTAKVPHSLPENRDGSHVVWWPLLSLLAIAAWVVFAGGPAILGAEAPRGGPAWVVDHRYAPVWWQTSICLPDDWQKTLVGKEGMLLYDYPGKHSGFKTRIAVGYEPQPQWVRQELVSARVPIVRTVKRLGDLEIVEEAFAAAPLLHADEVKRAPNGMRKAEGPAVERVDTGGGLKGWAHPTIPCDPAFRDTAVGWNDQVHYRVRAEGSGQYTVVFGLCEGWHDKPKQRLLELRIEGRSVKTVDMIAEHGKNVPALFPFPARDENADGWIDLGVASAPGSPDRNAILNVLWVFQGEAPPLAELIAGRSSRLAPAHLNCGTEPPRMGPPRHDVLLVRLRNTGIGEVSITANVTVDSEFEVASDKPRTVRIGQGTTLFTPSVFQTSGQSEGKSAPRRPWRTATLHIAAGAEQRLALGVVRGPLAPRPDQLYPKSAEQAEQLCEVARRYWESVDLPYGVFEVPDPGIQTQLDSSIRNIYQAREIKQGLPAFQVGPTCYRGLWVVDGSFLMEAVAFLGRIDEARNGIRYLLSFQRVDGAIMLIDGHLKETGIALWAVTRHARLTGDKAWLAEVWPRIEKGFQYIRVTRKEASADRNAPNYGLLPEGFSDGGLGGKNPEYTNVYWTLAGLKAAVEAARWLGKNDQAAVWQKEYEDFYAAFRRAAERDARTDPHGNRFVPISMRKDAKISPQKAQWAFLHAVFPGKVFAPDDPLVLGNMAMLRAAEAEGLVRDTGWVANGVWNYFGSFYAHGWLWIGQGRKAAETLYDFANHASPLLVWREEQMPVGEGDAVCGDMPHNWASAEFIRLVRHLLIIERGDELHLLEGLPPTWVRPGQTVKVRGATTEFGPMCMELRVAGDGSKAALMLDPPRRSPPKRIVLHCSGWSSAAEAMELPVDCGLPREIPLTPAKPR